MRILGLVLLLAVAAPGAPETPLGPYARTGVPVVLTSASPIVVELSGWRFEVDGIAAIAPPRVPCSVRFGDGALDLRAVPDGTLLVGLLGPGEWPATPGVRIQRMRLLDGTPWTALDLFDRLVWTGVDRPTDAQRGLLLQWVRMGGDLVAPRGVFVASDTGLGTLQSVSSPEEASPVALHPIPRLGNVLPEIYNLTPARGMGSPALAELRLLFLAIAVVLLLELVGGAGGWIGRRHFICVTLTVVVVGGALGTWLTRRAYEPFAEARIEVAYFPAGKSDHARVREFRILRAIGGGAALAAPEGIPLFYRGAGNPWWTAAGGPLPVDAGVSRAFSRDWEVVGVAAAGLSRDNPREVRKLLASLAPNGAETGWHWGRRFLWPVDRVAEPLLSVEVVAVR